MTGGSEDRNRGPRKDLSLDELLGGAEEGVDEEVRFYLDMRARELMEEEGLEREEALRRAVELFGDVDRIRKEARREARQGDRSRGRGVLLEGLVQDVRQGARSLLRRPGFSAAAVSTLAVGMVACAVMMAVIHAAYFQALPFADADRLVLLLETVRTEDGEEVRGLSYPNFLDLRQGTGSWQGVSGVEGIALNVTDGESAERIPGELVSPGYFRLLGVEPILGRTFTEEEGRAVDAAPVAVIREDVWDERFGRSPDVLGRTLRMNGTTFSVIGVVPASFPGITLRARIWAPFSMVSVVRPPSILQDREGRWFAAVGRLAPGVRAERARADLDALASRLQAAHPEANRDRGFQLQELRAAYLDSTGRLLVLLLGAVALLLLLACVNVANLLLARTAGRQRELGLRLALGSGRARVVRHLLVESGVLAVAGALVGVLLAAWATPALAAGLPQGLLPAFAEIRSDPLVLGAVFVVLAGVGVLAGLAPVLSVSRLEPAGVLRERSSGSSPAGGGVELPRLLVAGQVALALVLLVGAGLMVRSLGSLGAVDPGFEPENTLAFRLQLPPARYGPERRASFAAELRRGLEGVPGVEAAAVGSDLPLRGVTSAGRLWTQPGGQGEGQRYFRHRVEPGWFRALGVPLLEGRSFTPADDRTGELVVVVSESLARRMFPGESAVGKSLHFLAGGMTPRRVVGVVGDVRFRNLTADLTSSATDPDVYFPWAQMDDETLEAAVRIRGDGRGVLPGIREVVRGLDPGVSLYQVGDLATALRAQTAPQRLASGLLVAFAGIASFLAAVGLYGVMAFSVRRRRKEIAIRMAVGASAGRTRRSVVGSAMAMAGAGLLAGLVAAALLSRLLAGFLFGVEPLDLTVYAGVSAFLAVVALGAATFPALQATRVDPQATLRGE